MKKRVWIAAVIGLIASVSVAAAAGGYQTIRVYMDKISVAINSNVSSSNQESMVYNGSIYVPLRKISELLGAEVTWDAQNRTVNIDTVNVSIVNDIRNAHSLAAYQYLSVEKNLVFKRMEASLSKQDLNGLEEVVGEFERLADLADQLENKEISGLLRKMATSTELMRSGLASDNFDDYYLAWSLFENNATELNVRIKQIIEDAAG